jgi:hypothetical protein
MVNRKAIVSVVLTLVALIGALAGPDPAGAQSTDLFTCIELFGERPDCSNVGSGLVVIPQCFGRVFGQFIGFMAWFPLRNVGPIEVEIEAASSAFTHYPLYVQIVPLDGVDRERVCGTEPIPGYVIMTIFPRRTLPDDPCDRWESSGVIDISRIVPIGGLYALRLYAFNHRFGTSPGIDCVRITPVTSTVAKTTWGGVKWLYR